MSSDTHSTFVKACLIGHAIGDAFGVPLEFLSRKQVREVNLTKMIGYGDPEATFRSRWLSVRIPCGAWSDDTSMLYATMDSILQLKGKIDYKAIMDNFMAWWGKGKYTSLGQPFGLGGTVDDALTRYEYGIDPLECGGKDVRCNGNGALMRILPFSLYAIKTQMDERSTVELISRGSQITHGHDISKMSCVIYTELLRFLQDKKDIKAAYEHVRTLPYEKYFSEEALTAHQQLLNPSFPTIPDTQISEGNGYVVATLESALYGLLHSTSYKEALCTAVNMGYDTDTVGAVTGGLAGALYGYEGIPAEFKEKVLKRKELEEEADQYEALLDSLSPRPSSPHPDPSSS